MDVTIEEINEYKADEVNHPTHYNAGKIEVIEFIEDQGLNFSRGNAIKYIARAGKKCEGIQHPMKAEIKDLEKAVWYVRREIERLSATVEKREVLRPNNMPQPRANEADRKAFWDEEKGKA